MAPRSRSGSVTSAASNCAEWPLPDVLDAEATSYLIYGNWRRYVAKLPVDLKRDALGRKGYVVDRHAVEVMKQHDPFSG